MKKQISSEPPFAADPKGFPPEKKNTRIVWIDIFRALMIFAIAWGHTINMDPIPSHAVYRYLYSFHVPAFFYISGYLFSSENRTFLPFAGKKFLSLMVPYYIFAVISIAIFAVLGGAASEGLDVSVASTDILPNLLGMLYANGETGYMRWNLPLWFLPCLFGTALVFYGLEALAGQLKKYMGLHFAMGSILAISFLLAILNYYVFHLSVLPFGLEITGYMLPFYIAGYWVKIGFDFGKLSKAWKAAAGLICICVGAVLAICFRERVHYLTSQYDNLFVFYIAAFFSVAGYTLLSQLLSAKWLAYAGRNTLPILLMHKFPIVFLQMFLMSRVTGTVPLICVGALAAAAACALSLAAGEIIRRVLPLALGEKRRPAKKNNKQ